MRCQEAFEALSARFDGELSATDTAQLQTHVATCSACHAQEQQLALVARRLRGAAVEQPPVPAALRARITRSIITPTTRRRMPFVFGLAFLGAGVSMAALALVARARPAEVAPVANASANVNRPDLDSPNTPDNRNAYGNGPDSCHFSHVDSSVGKACLKGGLEEAKKEMKSLIKVARGHGMKLDCDSCHKNDEDWKLNNDARALFARVLETIRT